MKRKILITAGLLMIVLKLSFGESGVKVQLNETFRHLYLSGENQYIKTQKQVGFNELLQDALYDSFTFSRNFKTAMDSSFYCIRVDLQNTGVEDIEVMILVDDPRIDNLKFIMFENGKVVSRFSKYILDPQLTNPGNNLLTERPVKLKGGVSYKLYFQIDNRFSRNKLKLPLTIIAKPYYRSYQIRESLFETVYLGTLFFMVIFASLISLIYRKRIYGYYLLYLIGLILFYALSHNYAVYFANKENLHKVSWSLIAISYLLMIVGYVNFSQGFLEVNQFVKAKYLKIFTIFKWAFAIAQLVALILIWCYFPPLWLSYVTTLLLNPVLLLFIWFFIIKAIQNGYKPAYLFMLSYLPLFFVGFFLDPLAHSGLIGGNVNRIFYSGHIFELITLCIAVNFRFRMIETEKNNLNIMMLQQKENLLQVELKAQEAERERLAKDLHDDLGGTLTAIKNMALGKPGEGTLSPLIDRAIIDLRNLSRNLLPLNLSENGLIKAVQQNINYLQVSSVIEIDLITFGEEGRLNTEQELQTYRIITELLNNLVKHSGATKAVIQILSYEDYLHISVEDNGYGFNDHNYNPGIGLLTIQSRIDFLKSELRIETGSNGTFIAFDVNYNPVNPPNET